jgi:SAM-dependent methyltransferase
MPSTQEIQWSPEQVERFWNYQSSRPSVERLYFSVGHGARIVARTLPLLRRRGGPILDLGCGPGYLLRHLHARVGRRHALVGADFSPKTVERARQLCEGLDPPPAFKVVEGYPTPFADGSFDAIYSVEVVEHLPDDVLGAMLDDAYRLLAPGGMLVITTPNNEDLELLHTCCPACDATFHIWQHMRTWNRDTLSAALSRKGFVPVRVVATRFESRLVRLAYWLAGKLRRTTVKSPHLLGVFRKPA